MDDDSECQLLRLYIPNNRFLAHLARCSRQRLRLIRPSGLIDRSVPQLFPAGICLARSPLHYRLRCATSIRYGIQLCPPRCFKLRKRSDISMVSLKMRARCNAIPRTILDIQG
eukprot:TRINITY_DN12571_c0_g3_i1.p1 TRINITY_DN12571_c0_g3~~TRINITY_DN12571_c0_g3_i1.p1  ORF type:complete len:113 (+),score=2.71 TRINITY_DN12571_c0_g3_i1:26-364(+)